MSSLPSKGIYRADTALIRRAIGAALAAQGTDAPVTVEHIALEGGSDETGEWTTETEVANAREASGDPSVLAYIGPHNSGAAAAVLPITSRAGLLTSSPSATWPGLTQSGWDDGEPEKYYAPGVRNFVRLPPPDSYQAHAAAEWAAGDGRTSVLVLHDGSSYSEGMAREFTGNLPGVAREPSAVSISEESASLPELEGYDALFVAPSSVQSAGRLAAALRDSALTVYSTDVALDPQFLEAAGDAAGNWRIVSNGGQALLPAIAEMFPDVTGEVASSRPALNAYVVTRLVIEAVQGGERDREAVMAYVRSKRLPDGTPLFDEAGDPTAWTMVGYRAVDGEFQRVHEFSR